LGRLCDMSMTTIKVSTTTRDRIKALGAAQHQSADAVILEALAELERRVFWDQFDAAVAENPGDLAAESALYADSLKDGLGE
jgi:predicted transcriptional regulator